MGQPLDQSGFPLPQDSLIVGQEHEVIDIPHVAGAAQLPLHEVVKRVEVTVGLELARQVANGQSAWAERCEQVVPAEPDHVLPSRRWVTVCGGARGKWFVCGSNQASRSKVRLKITISGALFCEFFPPWAAPRTPPEAMKDQGGLRPPRGHLEATLRLPRGSGGAASIPDLAAI